MRSRLADPQPSVGRLFAGLRDPDAPEHGDDDPAALFVLDAAYGTRCSTLVLIDRAGAGAIVERRYDPQGRPAGETMIGFSWP